MVKNLNFTNTRERTVWYVNINLIRTHVKSVESPLKSCHVTHNTLQTNVLTVNTEKECGHVTIYRVSQEERTKLREGVPYVQLYRYNPKHECPKLNGY